MPLDPSLVGHETRAETGTIHAEDIRQFADAVGDHNPIFRDAAAAQLAGFRQIPAMPTFVTRFRVPFAESGLDPEKSQVLHGEQEYEYTRPLYAGDEVSVRTRVASIRQSARAGGMAIMTLEQLGDSTGGERLFTGRATVIVRDAPPDAAAGAAAASAPSASAKAKSAVPEGEAIAELVKHVTQDQINAYAEVSGDHNPIHLNPEAARAVGLEGTIAHGMLDMAFLAQMLTDWLTASQERHGWVRRLKARFQAMVRPGDAVICHGVQTAHDGETHRLEVWMDNEDGQRVITGDADVTFASA